MTEWSNFYSTRKIKMRNKAVNKINHNLDVLLKSGSTFQYKTEASSIKLNVIKREVSRIDAGIPVIQNVYLHDEKLMPPQEKGVFYIVPKIVAELYKDTRSDFIYPGTNPNEDGAILKDRKVVSIKQFRLPNVLSVENEIIEMI